MKPETELCERADWYGLDKGPGGHNYTPYYHSLFKGRRNEVKKVLEIGADRGWSLFLWRDYFPNAEIYCLEVDHTKTVNMRRIRTLVFDQEQVEDRLSWVADWAGNDFDLFIDDGSHRPHHQIRCANFLAPLINSSGFYIIEDVEHPDIVAPSIRFKSEVVQPKTARPDVVDDRLIVIRGEDIWSR